MLLSIRGKVGKPPGLSFLSREESGKHKIFSDGSGRKYPDANYTENHFLINLDPRRSLLPSHAPLEIWVEKILLHGGKS